jgi:hypothetical protein
MTLKRIIDTLLKEAALIAGTIVTICGACRAVKKTFLSKGAAVSSHLLLSGFSDKFNLIKESMSNNWQYILIGIGIIILIIEIARKKKK